MDFDDYESDAELKAAGFPDLLDEIIPAQTLDILETDISTADIESAILFAVANGWRPPRESRAYRAELPTERELPRFPDEE
jgi:hypothetical protein